MFPKSICTLQGISSSSRLVHEQTYVLFHHVQLLKQLDPLLMQLAKLFLAGFFNMLIFPWNAPMHILVTAKDSLVIIQGKSPMPWRIVKIFDSCQRQKPC